MNTNTISWIFALLTRDFPLLKYTENSVTSLSISHHYYCIITRFHCSKGSTTSKAQFTLKNITQKDFRIEFNLSKESTPFIIGVKK